MTPSGAGESEAGLRPGPATQEASLPAHDLNNVFTVLLGGISLADRHAAGNEPLVGLLESMRMAAERGAWIVQQMVLAERPAETDPQQAAAPQAPEAGTRHARILVVEDDSDVAEVAMAVLEGLGHLVDLAVNARQALERLAHGAYDLVFSDIVMPGGMSGIELAESIKATYPGLPVLLATGFSGAALGPSALRFPVLAKPYSVRELTSQTARLLAGA